MATKAEITTLITGLADSGNNTAAQVRDILNPLNENTVGATFEMYSKNLNGYPYTNTYSNGNIESNTFTTPNGNIVKTYNYNSSGDLETIVLSGVGLPAGVSTTKTFAYMSGSVSNITYS